MGIIHKLKNLAKSKLVGSGIKKAGQLFKNLLDPVIDFFTKGAKPKAKHFAKEAAKYRFEEAAEHANLIYQLGAALEQGDYGQFAYEAYEGADKMMNALVYPVKLYADYLHYQKLNNSPDLKELASGPSTPRIEFLDDIEETPRLALT